MTVTIPLKHEVDNSYDIIIDPLQSVAFDTKVAIVTNETIAPLHLDYLLERLSAKEVVVVTLKDGAAA